MEAKGIESVRRGQEVFLTTWTPGAGDMEQHHRIEIFSANCPLCRHDIDTIRIGKCVRCNMTVYDVNKLTEEIKWKMKDYGVKSIPTTVIDSEIKLVGDTSTTSRSAPQRETEGSERLQWWRTTWSIAREDKNLLSMVMAAAI